MTGEELILSVLETHSSLCMDNEEERQHLATALCEALSEHFGTIAMALVGEGDA